MTLAGLTTSLFISLFSLPYFTLVPVLSWDRSSLWLAEINKAMAKLRQKRDLETGVIDPQKLTF